MGYNTSMRPTVYIETTVPSYYCDERIELAADIARTREWWDEERQDYECFASAIVLEELLAGQYPNKDVCVALLRDVPNLEINEEIAEIARVYRVRKVMPLLPEADSLHVATAAYYKMNILLTWNCRHLANVRKEEHLSEINEQMNLVTPRIVTPYQLYPLEESL